jgi:hypothetical protein
MAEEQDTEILTDSTWALSYLSGNWAIFII